GEGDEGNEIAPIEGERFQLGPADVIAHRTAGGFQQRRLSVHLDGLRRLPQFQLYIQPDLVADAECNALLPVRAEARLLDRQHILPGGQPKEVVVSSLVRYDVEPRTRGLFLDAHFRWGYREALRILN